MGPRVGSPSPKVVGPGGRFGRPAGSAGVLPGQLASRRLAPLNIPGNRPILFAMARILIVDDDEVTRLILGRILQDAGHEVTYAGDGDMALGVFRIGRFDVVITDLAMPGRNGLRLIKDLQVEDWKLPLIAMSGCNAEQLPMAEDFGAKAVLYKPLEPELVLAAVDKVLGKASEDIWVRAWR